MRLLIVGINFHPELTGIGKYTGEMAAYLAETGHEVRVVTAPPYYPWWQVQPPYHWMQYRRETWRGVEVYRSPLWVPRRVSGVKRLVHLASFALFSAPLLLWQIRWKPDVVLAVAPALSAAPLALLTARLSGAKAWLHIQDFEVDAALGLGILPSQGAVLHLLLALERRLLRAFDVVSTISRRMCNRLWEKGVAERKIMFFPNWVDTNAIFPLGAGGGNLYRQMLGLKPEDIVILYAGNMGQKQGLEVLIEAAQRLRDAPGLHFVLCGDGAVRSSLEASARGMPNVHFLPLQPVEHLNLLLNMADIHVLPQRADAADLVMPSKLTGMFASGKPVVATAHPGTEVAQVIRETGVLVPPEDASALAAALNVLAKDPQRRAALGKQGRAFACEHYAREKVLANLHRALFQAVQGE